MAAQNQTMARCQKVLNVLILCICPTVPKFSDITIQTSQLVWTYRGQDCESSIGQFIFKVVEIIPESDNPSFIASPFHRIQ